MNEKQEQSILKSKIADMCRKKGVKMTFVYDLLCVSSSSYYRVLSKPLSDLHVDRLANFLDVPIETVHSWHPITTQSDIFDVDIELAENEPQQVEKVEAQENSSCSMQTDNISPKSAAPNSKKRNIKYAWSLVILTLMTLTFALYLKNSETYFLRHTGNFAGFGTDYDISNVEGLSDFHTQLYSYKFENVEVAISGNDIEMITNIYTNSLDGENADYIGIFKATGKYLNGFAAMHYKITADFNGEEWIGVMMLKIGTTGHAKGYWLTAHHDGDATSPGPFAFGDTNLRRVQEKISKAIADSRESE
ncbi:hypothetical protein DXX93_14940 [Thalassotalea euphylliae]|uniref:Uncharacterized protein n=1 Tax=Thalassotalea euphylliae TaxID=1655234 RepID=A0A3E0TUX3_9GAMM|nr:hypothetical protein [Thalassotalea euphylliae]REL27725.1 hypothetical protein DXX93_14940 [Thalassotalea euphylliae]